MNTAERTEQHTLGPWELMDGSLDVWANGRRVSACPWTIPGKEDEANARRIVAAVNATEGIPTSALESGVVREMAALLREVTPADSPGEWWCPSCTEWLPGTRVTYQECCDTCGTYLGDVNQPQWVDRANAILEKLGEGS